LKDRAAAEQSLRHALEIRADLLEAYTMLGQLYLAQGRTADAKREFAALAEREPKPVAALTMLGIIAHMDGDAPKAIEHFQRVVDLEPRAFIAANNLAWLYAERGERLDYALQLAQTAVQIEPKSPEARDTLGWVYYKRQTSPTAITAFQEAIALSGGNATYHYHLALAHLLGESPEGAKPALEKALALGGRKAPWGADAERRLAALALTK
jgi:tetratricopeptide (TPR) repeat protein